MPGLTQWNALKAARVWPGGSPSGSRVDTLIVSSLPSRDDNWVKRLFVGDGPQATFFAYDETTNLTLTQWDALKAAHRPKGR